MKTTLTVIIIIKKLMKMNQSMQKSNVRLGVLAQCG